MTRARILIVEDDPAIRRGLADAMAFDGFETIACGDGNEGLERARSGAFDLVLLDVMLPGSYGAICGAANVTITITHATTAQNAERGLRLAKALTP
jgi:DNA-binding response OmpR family regulator